MFQASKYGMFVDNRSWLVIATEPNDTTVSDRLRFANIGLDADIVVATATDRDIQVISVITLESDLRRVPV